MRIPATLVAALALLLALGALRPAAAEDAPGPRGHWLYEVRIVRVDPADAAAAETGSAFPEMDGTTIDLPWGAILKRLKQRGKTTVLMDSRLTALTGVKAVATQEASTPIVALNFQDRNNEQFRSQLVKEGCTFEQITSDTLHYTVQVRGCLTPPLPQQAPVQYVVNWNGTHARLAGRTLVLEHRQQVAVARRVPAGERPAGRVSLDLGRLRQRLKAQAAHLDELTARIATVERELEVTARRDTAARLARELEELRRGQAAAEKGLAEGRRRERELVAAQEHARTGRGGHGPHGQRAIEHYAFVSGRFVEK